MKRFLDNCKKLQKRAKKGPKMLILGYFDIFYICGPFFVHFEPKKKIQNFKKNIGKI